MIQNIPSDHIAAVVTYLEMRSIPAPNADVLTRADVSLQAQTNMSCEAYRDMFREVGQDWLWFSRLRLSDDALRAILHAPHTALHTLHDDSGQRIGFLELDIKDPSNVELSFLGVVPGSIGRGFGSYLMAHAFRLAKDASASRLWVHTCTFDHPGALAFYEKAGFRVYDRAVEITPDPRLDGTLSITVASHVPLLRG